jgi:aminomethyltransferase
MVDFGGWEMPIYYKGVLPEHHAVREWVGIFDVSHMGRIVVKGKDAEKLLDFLSTNRISGKPDGSATYTVWCNVEGKAVDDLIIYRQSKDEFFVIVNAANRIKDLAHLKEAARTTDVHIEDHYADEGILAIQGPKADGLIEMLFPEVIGLAPMHFSRVPFRGKPIILSKTGYTGSGGYEIYAPQDLIVELWDLLLKEGQPLGIEPIGLGARDTLRMEMGFALYGHELSESIAVTESVSAWTVKWNKDFLGKQALQQLETNPAKRHACGVILQEKGVPREHCDVKLDGKSIGSVTSGTFSPTLQKGIAIVLASVPLTNAQEIELIIRDKAVKATVVKLPFLRENKGEKP